MPGSDQVPVPIRQSVYEVAHLARVADEFLRREIDQGRFYGFVYSAAGQEIIGAALGNCLLGDDWLVTTYRGMHDQIGRSIPLAEIMAEIYGRSSGCCKGKGGPMHVTDPDRGVMATTGIVGGGLPIAVGLGMAAQIEGRGRVVAVSFGDGATNTGAFHEAINLAVVWKVPLVFVCQNNGYGEFTPRGETQHGAIVDRGTAYGLPARQVDGNDLDSLLPALSVAIDHARRGDGPMLLDCETYRLQGHYYGDPMTYMPAAELEERRAADPLLGLRRSLLEFGIGEVDLARIEAANIKEVEVAIAAAGEAPQPSVDDLLTDVYAVGGQK